MVPLPDFWQQQAVRELRAGRDVVVQAPTGAGKTHIFELLQSEWRGRAIYTVPTRALANDKLAEWRARGWDVGICTGDLSERPEAKVVVATLETQRGKFLRGEGPSLLVIDEYQMLADPVRGPNYELGIILAPRDTRLLLLSGSVANPADVADWLRRLGRDAALVTHDERPVPLQEVMLDELNVPLPVAVQGHWPRLIARALKAELGPVLVFAPHRAVSEQLARALASGLPAPDALVLSREQAELAGGDLAGLLAKRVAYHHSGLGYAVRAGLVEPLAKAGQLRAVVATTGLAAGINFSLRSVLVTGTTYRAGPFERNLEPDELLQMFGRAGRRGLDEAGYVLVIPGLPRLHDARTKTLRSTGRLDWAACLGVMRAASARGEEPFAAAAALAARRMNPGGRLGVEKSLADPGAPCGLLIDGARARLARKRVEELEGPDGRWYPKRPATQVPAGRIMVKREGSRWEPLLARAEGLQGCGEGNPCLLRKGKDRLFGREIPVALRRPDGRIEPTKWLKRHLTHAAGGREAWRGLDQASFRARVEEWLPALSGGGRIAAWVDAGDILRVRADFSGVTREAFPAGESYVVSPSFREMPAMPCRGCPRVEACLVLEIEASPAFWWHRLGLVDGEGTVTRRGAVFGFFHAAEGFAVAVGLEDEEYALDDLVFDLANLRAGPRFAGLDSPYAGRLGFLCQRESGRADIPGLLSLGVPEAYGAGAAEVAMELATRPGGMGRFAREELHQGDIERMLVEWRSLLRHIAAAPPLDWSRWMGLRETASAWAGKPAGRAVALPPLSAAQTNRRRSRL